MQLYCFFRKRNSSHFAQIAAVIGDLDAAALEFVSAFRGMVMRSIDESPRMAGEYVFQHDAPAEGFERDALQLAKERQDKVHAALDVWITAAIAELASERRRRPSGGTGGP